MKLFSRSAIRATAAVEFHQARIEAARTEDRDAGSQSFYVSIMPKHIYNQGACLYCTTLGEIEMAATLVIIATGGVAMGLFVRASALAAGSLIVLLLSVAQSLMSGQDFLSGAAVSLASVAILQVGYLAGLLLSSFVRTNNTRPPGHD
jgi:hypothetical protein